MALRTSVRQHRRLLMFAMAGALAVVVVGGSSAQPTSAAWTDSAEGSAAASSGSWSAGPGTCSVEKLPGYTGVWNNPACTVTALNGDVPWGAPGSRQTNLYVALSFSGSVAGGQESNFRIVITLNLASTENVPTDWNWSTTGVGLGNLLSKANDYQCSSLAQSNAPFKAYVHGNYFVSSQVFFPLYENSGGITGLICP